MTTVDRTAHQARIHRISEGVVASYIHDLSASTAVGDPSAMSRRHGGQVPGRASRAARASRRPGGSSPEARALHAARRVRVQSGVQIEPNRGQLHAT
jgi:hypothetical protein